MEKEYDSQKSLTPAQQREEMIKRIRFYQRDPLGAETWIEDHVNVCYLDFYSGEQQWLPMGLAPETPHPQTGRSYKEMWQWQKENIIRPATSRDEHGMLIYHTVVSCLPRGEGKSFNTVLLILWRFCTQPRQLIILGANSKDQSKFALYDQIRDTILNSPKLLAIIGEHNIKEKEIRFTDSNGNTVSKIMAVSAFTGIYSNITAFAFTEIFDMTNPKFFYQLDSSRRNIANSQGYIDSTVSEKGHVLHDLYENSPLRNDTDPGILFIYRYSEKANQGDYLHPCNTQKQLNSFKAKFIEAEFARYFKNTWDLIDTAVFRPGMISAMRYIGYGNVLGANGQVQSDCRRMAELRNEEENHPERDNSGMIKSIECGLKPLPYNLIEDLHPRSMTANEAAMMSDIYDTNWALGVGADLADPLKDDTTRGARTILSFILKGLPGSRSDPHLHLTLKDQARYIYLLAHLQHIESNEPEDIQAALEDFIYEFGSIQTLCSERWGAATLRSYCEEKGIGYEFISPVYEKQRTGFNAFYRLVKSGYFKAPPTAVHGSETEDIMEEEMLAFRHDPHKKWYGSMTKKNPSGIQDDVMFSLCWNLYGLQNITPDDFVAHTGSMFMGAFIPGKSLIGKY